MKIKQKTALDTTDYRSALKIEVETEGFTKNLEFMDGEPEDANLSRDFSDCYLIPKVLKEAYEAGKRGEPFEFTEEEVEFGDI